MAIPDYQTLMLPVLRAAATEPRRISDLADPMAAEFRLTPAERDELLGSGRQKRLHNRIYWAKRYMQKAGLLHSPRRGWFVATDAGRQLLASNPPRIDNHLLLGFPGFQEFYKPQQNGHEPARFELGEAAADASTATPEEQIEAAFAAMQSSLREDLLGRVLQNSPSFFERLIVDLLVAMGYGGSHKNAAMQLGRSGDGGVDGIVNEDVLGLDRLYVQAKRYTSGVVGRPEVQAFTGSLVGFGANKGVFVTTSTFSRQAIDFAERVPQRLILIDGARLTELMVEHDVGVRTTRQLEFKRLDEDFFLEDE